MGSPLMLLSPEFVRQGAIYALEQCGLLLSDAKVLVERGSFANAVVLAAFGREELGRARILWKLENEAERKGKNLTADEIERECGDHVAKQQSGQLSITQYADAESGLGKLHRAILENPVSSKEHKTAQAKLDRLTKLQEKRGPQQRHKERMDALYVGISNDTWNRPQKVVTREYAEKFIEAAIQDYRIKRYGDPESEMNKFLEAWEDHPVLPEL